MLNWLLQPQPDSIIGPPPIDSRSMLIGACIGFTVAMLIWGFAALAKFLISYSEKPDKPNSKESDE